MSSLDVRSIDDKQVRRAPCPPLEHGLRVVLSEQAFDRAVARGETDTTREIGGVLVGELLRDDAGLYLLIDSTVDALHAEEKGAELTFTHATWEHIHKEMDGKHKAKRVVGWYHTHPGFGVFLSDRDQFIHKSFFNLPFQIALVYDPKSREHGVFQWRDNEVWRARRYWIGAREQLWDGPRAAVERGAELRRTSREPGAEAGAPDERDASNARDDLSLGSLGSLAVLGLVVLLVGGFVGHWLGVGSANQALAGSEQELANARTDGAARTIAMLQSDLVGVLRDALGDDAMHRPLVEATRELDRALAELVPGGTMPLAGSAAGSGAGSAAGSGSGAAAAGDARLEQVARALKASRDRLVALDQTRWSAQSTLAALDRGARRGADLRADLGRDVAEQRTGIGTLYAELAADAVKAGDPVRARRLLATAAHLDPGNRVRYEAQLRAFDKAGALPPDTREPHDSREVVGPAGQGSVR